MSPIKRPSAVWQVFGRPITSAILIGGVVAIGVLVGNIIMTHRNIAQLDTDMRWVSHTFQVIGSLEHVFSVMKDAETSQRGYIITRDEKYLEPYHNAVASIDGAVAELDRLTADNTMQQARMPRMREILADRVQTLEESLVAMKDSGVEGARHGILTGRGKQQMGELRGLVRQMIESERSLLAERQVVSNTAYRTAVMASGITGVAALVATVALISIFVLSAVRCIEAEEERRIRMQELAHASRLTTVGQMMSELSHELNQPLGAAANFAGACARLARGSATPNLVQLAELSDKAAEQAGRAVEIVKRVSAFAKKGSGQRTRVNLNDLVENVVALTIPSMRRTNGDDIATTMDLDDDMPEVAVDRVQIEQVLVNLIRNATEAMQAPECHEKALSLVTRRQGDFVEVSVEDHGPGIPPETMKQLFSPYFTTKEQGMGLGLSISRSILEQHNGQISAESSDRGTRFRFTLPITAA